MSEGKALLLAAEAFIAGILLGFLWASNALSILEVLLFVFIAFLFAAINALLENRGGRK